MAGSGSGAIIAIMLGRLRFSIHRCLQEYVKLLKCGSILNVETGTYTLHKGKLMAATENLVKAYAGSSYAFLQHTGDPLGELSCKV